MFQIKSEFDQAEISGDYDPRDRLEFFDEIDVKPEIFDPNEVPDSPLVSLISDIKEEYQPPDSHSRRSSREVRARQFPDYEVTKKKPRKERHVPLPAPYKIEDVQDFEPFQFMADYEEPVFHPDFVVAEVPTWHDAAQNRTYKSPQRKQHRKGLGTNALTGYTGISAEEKREAMKEYQRKYRERKKEEERLKKMQSLEAHSTFHPDFVVATVPHQHKVTKKRIGRARKRKGPGISIPITKHPGMSEAEKREAMKEYQRKYREKLKEKQEEKRLKKSQNTSSTKTIHESLQPSTAPMAPNEARPRKKPTIFKDFVTEIPANLNLKIPEVDEPLKQPPESTKKIISKNSSEFVMAVDISEILQKNTEEPDPEVPVVNEDVLLGIGVTDSDVEVVDEFPVTEEVLKQHKKRKEKKMNGNAVK